MALHKGRHQCPSAHAWVQVVLKKDPVQLSFALAGIRTPLRAQQASAGRPSTQDEPHCHEALALTRRLVLQREVELDVRHPRSDAVALCHSEGPLKLLSP